MVGSKLVPSPNSGEGIKRILANKKDFPMVNPAIMKSPAKSCVLDPWPTFLVKECLDILVPSITKLVNCSLSKGVVPADFKKAVVTPLIKKSSLPPDDLKNY